MTNDQWIKAENHAVGAYQFIGNTLPGVASRAGIPDNAKFSPGNQDLMALQLMKERGFLLGLVQVIRHLNRKERL